MIRLIRKTFVRPRVMALLIIALHASSRPASAQVDPLLFLKTQKPTILFLVDTSARMQYDADGTYYDPWPYTKTSASWEANIGVTPTTTSATYYRKFPNFHAPGLVEGAPVGTKYVASRIETVGDLQQPAYTNFLERTRMQVLKRGLTQAVDDNLQSVRFSLLRLGQTAPDPTFPPTQQPVYVTQSSQQAPSPTEVPANEFSPAGWKVHQNTSLVSTSSATTIVGPLLPDSVGGNQLIKSTLATSIGTTGALVPAGLNDLGQIVAPLGTLLQHAITEVTNLLTGAPVCSNAAIVMVVGGGEVLSLQAILTVISQLLGLIFNHRIPVHIIAIAPPPGDVAFLRSLSDMTGGQFTEVTKAQIEATVPGQPVPEVVNAVNWAVQHALLSPTEFNGATTAAALRNLTNEHQTSSPITGSVDLKGRSDITGALLPNTSIFTAAGVAVPQQSNVMVTSGFSIPGFDGKLRAFRTYKPVPDVTKPSGYRFSQDGTRLWVASTPAAASRNIFTVLPDGTMTAFSAENASTLAPYLGPVDPANLIQRIRSQPLGAIVGSTPAIMDAPSLDPPPDAAYASFKDLNKNRRSIIFVGANDGMFHAIDGRTGIELWAFIPFNLLPKLRTLTWGHGVDAGFRYMTDSSPKLSDVKVNGEWRTYLFFGQSGGGTFYNTLDVTLHRMGETIQPTNDAIDPLLSYFAVPTRISWVWSFPRLTSFDATIAPYGDVSVNATDLEKSVGQTWSDPAVGRMGTAEGDYGVFVGSGFFPYSKQQQSNRGGIIAGRTFYILSAETGGVLASRDVGSDSLAENVDDCRAAGNCMRIKNALQMDPVATGPLNSQHAVDKVYIGDLDGRLWRMAVTLGPTGGPVLSTPVKLYDVGAAQPLFGSMAAVNVGSNQTYIFYGTGSDALPSTGVSTQYEINIVLDTGDSTADLKFEQKLAKTDSSGDEEKVTGFPAVAGDIVFFSTTTIVTSTPCTPFNTSLYAFTFTGGPAYDTTGDGKIDTKGNDQDSTKLFTRSNARGTAPFIVDQHLFMGVGSTVEIFGDENDFNNSVGQSGVRILSWREVR